MVKKKADYLFELSWEVCNKVGGINTVIKSKIPATLRIYGSNYFLIGPYFHEKAVSEFQEKIPPKALGKVFEKLKKKGIVCHFGKWLTHKQPNTILVDYQGYTSRNYELKGKLWTSFEIDSLGTYFHDFDEPMLWGAAAGELLEELVKTKQFRDQKIVAHFHEWLSCGALLHLKMNDVKIASVFTTHGTMLGRALAGNNVELYHKINNMDPEKEAYDWHVHPKHQVERVSAHVADVFTTVSEITALQVNNFLRKKPDILLYNGMNIDENRTFEQISVDHLSYKEKIKEFLTYYFFPYYQFDLNKTLIFFTTGRYEFHNKGFDLFIESLAKLNRKLKKEKSKKTIVAFFWVPRDTLRIKPEITHNRTYFEDIQESIEDSINDIKNRIIRNLISGKSTAVNHILKEQIRFETKKKVLKFHKKGVPPLCTHDLPQEESDPILSHLKKNNLLNAKEDRVKTIFYPIYLTGADSLLDLNYDEAILGSHLGVFPSYYEPWGYTPLETAALGVASITTDYAGFGRYLMQDTSRVNRGVYILEIFNKSHKKKIDILYNSLYDFSKLSVNQRVKNKVEAYNIALMVDWAVLINNYVMAHNSAIKKVYN
ncbi:MAG: hypothetical protein B6U97_00535 [Candidatus Altiarchaeales archaeon ex4484_96]|nr:MAG: hypothetical protein B6U97_00535 [Candidatus Altiarchaeales archaeon ex4484_96]